MNWLDIALLVLIAASIFGGLKAGIIKILFSIAGLIIGVVLAGHFSSAIGSRLTFISNADTASIIAFIIIMLVVMIVAAILAFVLKKVASLTLLGWVNYLGGAVLGLVLGAIFCAAILTIWVKYLGISDAVAGSAISNFLLDKFPIVMGLLPSEFDSVRSFFR